MANSTSTRINFSLRMIPKIKGSYIKEDSTMKLQKMGGVGALVNAIGMIIFLFLNTDMSFDPAKGFDTISNSINSYMILYFGLVFGVLGYILFVSALRERMEEGAPNLMRIAVIGLSITCTLWLAGALIGIVGMPTIINTKDPSAYRAVGNIIISFLTAGDFAAGCVLLVIGWAALNLKGLPLILSWLSMIKGLDMVLSIFIDSLVSVGMFLGIVFYTWLGILLLLSKK
jgi:hypothetical protein